MYNSYFEPFADQPEWISLAAYYGEVTGPGGHDYTMMNSRQVGNHLEMLQDQAEMFREEQDGELFVDDIKICKVIPQ
jgi:hypothetical protein